jgi:hypothetical protein
MPTKKKKDNTEPSHLLVHAHKIIEPNCFDVNRETIYEHQHKKIMRRWWSFSLKRLVLIGAELKL